MRAPNRRSAHTAAGNGAATVKASGKASRKSAKGAGAASGKSAKVAGKSPAGAGKVAQQTARGAGKAAQNTVRGTGKAAQQAARGAGKAGRAGTVMAANRAVRSTRREVNSRTRATRAWWRGLKRGFRARPRRLLVVNASAPQRTAAALGGAGIAFLLDPANGKRRRQVARDRAVAVARRTARRGGQNADDTVGKAQGTEHDATSPPSAPDPAVHDATSPPSASDDDRTLAESIRAAPGTPAPTGG
jgi:hypothetical protein